MHIKESPGQNNVEVIFNMKLYRDKNKEEFPIYAEEFSEEFANIEEELVKAEIAGGPITKRVRDEFGDLPNLQNLTRS